MTYRKKLIDVSLPLEAINAASVREKSIRHGHPSTLHLWWSRKPLATCRAVLFASLIDDPSENTIDFPSEEDQKQERKRLFSLLEKLIVWKNSQNEEILAQVLAEIHKPGREPIPPIRDPFCGGGSIPLEAQRLGLEARSSDLNPVAVLITKALIEIPPKFANHTPIAPTAQEQLIENNWSGARGLAYDIRYYGNLLCNEAKRRIGYLYPSVKLPREYSGGEAPIIAWLWARTVTCPNPACQAQMPLTSEWWLSKKTGKQVWIDVCVDHNHMPPVIEFSIQRGGGKPQDGTVTRQGARCIACGSFVPLKYIRSQGKIHRMGTLLMAIAAEGKNGRIYVPPNNEHVSI